MGFELMDVVDVICFYMKVVDYLKNIEDEYFLDEFDQLEGGKEVRKVVEVFFDKYGMCCVGEIDLMKMCWSENLVIFILMIFNNIKNFELGVGKWKFEQGWQEVLKKEQELFE